jgi:hypothetical protein
MKRIGVVVDLETGKTTNIPVRPEFIDPSVENVFPCRPFGITWNGDELYIANNRQLLVFDRQFQYVRTLRTPLQANVHQLAYRAKCIWAVSPRTNSLIGVDPRSELATIEFDLLNKSLGGYRSRLALEADDKHHFNSLLWANGYLFVAAHNFMEPSFINRYKEPNLDLDNVEYYAGDSIHGLALYDKELFWVSTQTYEIRSSLGYCHSLPKTGFARGFSMTREYFIVAISEFLARDERHGGDSWVQVIDRQNGNVVKEWHLPETGSINDLRLLDEYDYAHCVAPFYNRASRFPWGLDTTNLLSRSA